MFFAPSEVCFVSYLETCRAKRDAPWAIVQRDATTLRYGGTYLVVAFALFGHE